MATAIVPTLGGYIKVNGDREQPPFLLSFHSLPDCSDAALLLWSMDIDATQRLIQAMGDTYRESRT